MKKYFFILLLFSFLWGVIEIVRFINFPDAQGSDILLQCAILICANIAGFTALSIVPLALLFFFWGSYENNGFAEKRWKEALIFWGIFPQLALISLGIPKIDRIPVVVFKYSLMLNCLVMLLCYFLFGVLSFYFSSKIIQYFRKGDAAYFFINLIFIIVSTLFINIFLNVYDALFLSSSALSVRNILDTDITFMARMIFVFAIIYLSSAFFDRIFKSAEKESSFLPKAEIAFPLILMLAIGVSSYGYSINREENINLSSGERGNREKTIPKEGRLNVLLISIDTLRSDHLSCYGYHIKDISPNIDRLAKEGVLFKNSYSNTSWTKPSVASLFTSLYPSQHGVLSVNDTLPDKVSTLSEILKDRGYKTGAVVSNPNIKKIFNFDQGFEFYYDKLFTKRRFPNLNDTLVLGAIYRVSDAFSVHKKKIFAEDMNDLASLWIEENRETNFFLYLHYNDVHAPYDPPEENFGKFNFQIDKRNMNAVNMALYDSLINYIDFYIGQILDTLDKSGLRENTLVILTADHGEAFLEHNNREHGTTLYNEEISVPLIMRLPEIINKNQVIEYQACTIDLFPTILDMLDIEYDGLTEGQSLLPAINRQTEEQRDYLFHQLDISEGHIQIWAIRKGDYKYIYHKQNPSAKGTGFIYDLFFDLKKDGREFVDVKESNADKIKELRTEMFSLIKHIDKTSIASQSMKIDKETKNQLRALGYIN